MDDPQPSKPAASPLPPSLPQPASPLPISSYSDGDDYSSTEINASEEDQDQEKADMNQSGHDDTAPFSRDPHARSASPRKRRSLGARYYFAYGSNLSSTQMRQRCPGSAALALARLPGFSFIINTRGFANVIPTPPLVVEERAAGRDHAGEEGVYGVLYRLDEEHESTLDVFEGVPWAYEKVLAEVEVVGEGEGEGERRYVDALVYIDRQRRSPGPPRPEYVRRMNRAIEEARREWQLPEEYVVAVMRGYIPEQ